jgi:ABC-2 type transport system permease protein
VRTIHAELLKIRTAPRTVIGLVLGMLAIVGVGAAGTVSSYSNGSGILRDLMDIASFSLVFAVIVGLLVVTWEFRHGTIEQTFIVSPRRERVMAAKAVAAAFAGAVLSVLSIAVTVTIAYIWIGGDPGVDFTSGELWERAVRVVVAGALWGALGVGAGALVRNQAGAIVLVFVWLFVLEPIVPLISDTAAKYTLGRLREAFLDVGGDHGVALGTAGLLLALYAVTVAAAGSALTLRRDIT